MEHTEVKDSATLKKEKIYKWIKDPYNLTFIILILLIIGVRLYYFDITKTQALWWDESEYMAAAKSFAGIVHYEIASYRLPGFPLVGSIFYILGINNEIVLRIFLNLIPSIFAIILLYFLVVEMYPKDKRIALITMALFGFLWEHVFYSQRFHTENWGLMFQFISLIVLFKCVIKKEKLFFIKPKWSLIWVILFALLSIFFRPGNSLFIPSAVVLLLLFVLPYKSKIFNKKTALIWIMLIIIGMIGFISLMQFAPKEGVFTYFHPEVKITWENIYFFKGYFDSLNPSVPPVLFYITMLGMLVVLFNFYLYIDKFNKFKTNSEDLELKSDMFATLQFLSVIFFFIFIIRSSWFLGELRWYFPILPSIFIFTSKGMTSLSDFIFGYMNLKKFSFILIISLLIFNTSIQLSHADMIIKAKLDSYSQVRDAALWMKENTNKNDVILSRSLQTIYYSEREVYFFRSINETQFLELVGDKHPKYMFESALEPATGEWGLNPTEKMQKFLVPVNVWFLDKEKKQPIAIVYEIDYNKFDEVMNPTATPIKNVTLPKETNQTKNKTSNNTINKTK